MENIIVLVKEELVEISFDSSYLDEYERAFLNNLNLDDINE